MAENTAGTFTEVPASIPFSTLYQRVANYVMGPSDAEVVTICKEGINEAILKINTRSWTWSRDVAAITFTAGENGREYQLATNFHSPRSFELLDSASRIVDRLQYEDGKTFDRWFADRSAANDPTHYTVFNLYANGYLTLNAAPGDGFVGRNPTGRLRYYKKLPLLSGDSDLFAGPTEAEAFLVWYARSVVAAHWDQAKADRADEKAGMWWASLVQDDLRTDLRDTG